MKFTDGKKIVDITITDNNSGTDVTADLMEVGYILYNEDVRAYMVSDVDYCIDFAKSEFLDANVNVDIK